MKGTVNVSELIRRIIKYLVEGLMVAIAAYAIPKRSLNMEEIILIALTAAATFSILDTYVPTMGVTARSGAGFGIGANMVRFPGGF
jgi:ABC-type Co2+ transport system permease subunit